MDISGIPIPRLCGWLLTRRAHIDLLRTASAACRA